MNEKFLKLHSSTDTWATAQAQKVSPCIVNVAHISAITEWVTDKDKGPMSLIGLYNGTRFEVKETVETLTDLLQQAAMSNDGICIFEDKTGKEVQ